MAKAGDKEDAKPTTGVGERLKATARRLRGSKDDQATSTKAQAKGQTSGAARKSTTPRKVGGS